MVTHSFWASLEPLQIDRYRTPFCFVNISASFYRTEMVLHAKCAYTSWFSGEKHYLKIRYLVAEILSKMHIGTPCMHFLTFGGPKRQIGLLAQPKGGGVGRAFECPSPSQVFEELSNSRLRS